MYSAYVDVGIVNSSISCSIFTSDLKRIKLKKAGIKFIKKYFGFELALLFFRCVDKV